MRFFCANACRTLFATRSGDGKFYDSRKRATSEAQRSISSQCWTVIAASRFASRPSASTILVAERLRRTSKLRRCEIAASAASRDPSDTQQFQLWQPCRWQEDPADRHHCEYWKHFNQRHRCCCVKRPVLLLRTHYAPILTQGAVQHISSVVRPERRRKCHWHLDDSD